MTQNERQQIEKQEDVWLGGPMEGQGDRHKLESTTEQILSSHTSFITSKLVLKKIQRGQK